MQSNARSHTVVWCVLFGRRCVGDSERTNVIVVGAGASKEFNLPTGAELTLIIQKDLDFKVDRFGSMITGRGDWELRRAIEILSQETDTSLTAYANIAKQISRNMALARLCCTNRM